MGLEVVSDTPEECLTAKVNTQHANYRTSFEIADVVKNLVYLEGVPHRHLDRVGGSKRVKMECLLHTLSLGKTSMVI